MKSIISDKIQLAMKMREHKEYKSIYQILDDGSIVTNPEGKKHTVQKHRLMPNGGWFTTIEMTGEEPITLPALQQEERYLFSWNGIIELMHYLK